MAAPDTGLVLGWGQGMLLRVWGRQGRCWRETSETGEVALLKGKGKALSQNRAWLHLDKYVGLRLFRETCPNFSFIFYILDFAPHCEIYLYFKDHAIKWFEPRITFAFTLPPSQFRSFRTQRAPRSPSPSLWEPLVDQAGRAAWLEASYLGLFGVSGLGSSVTLTLVGATEKQGGEETLGLLCLTKGTQGQPWDHREHSPTICQATWDSGARTDSTLCSRCPG